MNWTIENAEQNLSKLINQAEIEPQAICDDKQVVVAVIDAQTFKQFEQWQQSHSPSSAFAELRQICVEEDYYAN